MPQTPRKGKSFSLATAQQLDAQGLSYRAIAQQLGTNYSAVYRALTAAPQAGEPPSEPGSPRLDDLEARVDVLECFIKTLQAQPAYLPGSPHGSPMVHHGAPTHKRGFVLRDDLFDAIHRYATAHQCQVKDVLDAALRQFFAEAGEAVGDA